MNPGTMSAQVEQIIQQHRQVVAGIGASTVANIAAGAGSIIEALQQGHRVYICGNGGSAADAQHIAGELLGRFRRTRRPLPAVALTTDTSTITSVANDFGYEHVFERQVEALVEKGDILWAISTSGSSASVVAAAETAKNKGAKVLAFTGRKDSALERLSDVCVCAGSDSTARSQEIHQLAYHIICELIDRNFAEQ